MEHHVRPQPFGPERPRLEVALEDARRVTEERRAHDGLDDVLDPGVDGRDLPGQHGQPDGVDALEAADLEHVLVSEAEMLVEQAHPAIRHRRRHVALALLSAAESATMTVRG